MIQRYEEFTKSISSIYKIIQRIKRDEMAKFGLKGPHAQCMVAMHHCPDGATISQLCEMCELDKAAISRAVAELEEKGIIEARISGDKLYRARLRLTQQGQEIAAKIGGVAEEMVAAAGEGLSEQDRRVFYASLNRITANLQRLMRDGADTITSKGK